MSDKTDLAYRAAHAAARAILESVVKSIKDAIEGGEVSAGDIHERINEEVDNALVYTAERYAVVWGLPDPDEDAIGDCGANDWNEALSKQAFHALRDAVNNAESWESLCEDAAEEREDDDPNRAWLPVNVRRG